MQYKRISRKLLQAETYRLISQTNLDHSSTERSKWLLAGNSEQTRITWNKSKNSVLIHYYDFQSEFFRKKTVQKNLQFLQIDAVSTPPPLGKMGVHTDFPPALDGVL